MRTYSLAYLTANASTVPQAIGIAAELGYAYVGLRVPVSYTHLTLPTICSV